MADLSPAAQAVLYAYGNEVGGSAAITSYERRGIAAALRAAALYSYCPIDRRILMTIADELENHQ